MFEAYLKAKITNKTTNELISECEVMEIKYKVTDNTLWITDHHGFILNFDLNECSAEIVSI